MNTDREALIGQYAAGEITWFLLRQEGFDNYRQLLAGLGELGLRPPIAPRGPMSRRGCAAGRSFDGFCEISRAHERAVQPDRD